MNSTNVPTANRSISSITITNNITPITIPVELLPLVLLSVTSTPREDKDERVTEEPELEVALAVSDDVKRIDPAVEVMELLLDLDARVEPIDPLES